MVKLKFDLSSYRSLTPTRSGFTPPQSSAIFPLNASKVPIINSFFTRRCCHHWPDRPCGLPRGPSRYRARTNRTRPCLPWRRSHAVTTVRSTFQDWERGCYTILTCFSGSMLAKPPEWLDWPPLEAISRTSSLSLEVVSDVPVDNCFQIS